jgi:hypothetical protein
MTKLAFALFLALTGTLGCSSPTTVEVRPNPLILEGQGAKGRLRAVVFDADGKDITGDHAVTWMCLDTKNIKIQQDGTVVALSSGQALVDAEVVGTDLPSLPGYGLHGGGTVIVKIPSWVEVSHERLNLETGQKTSTVWAEVRNDLGHPMTDYLPTWKVDNPAIVSIESSLNRSKTRTLLTLTALAPGETFLTASYKDLAGDILLTVSTPQAAAPAPSE